MHREFVTSAFIIAFSIIVISYALTFLNYDNYALAFKKHQNNSLQPSSSYSNNEFYKTIDGLRNRCHNDYGINAVVCVRDNLTTTADSSPQQESFGAKDTGNSSTTRSQIMNETMNANSSSTAATMRADATRNDNGLEAVGPTYTLNDSNADTSAILSTPMTPESLDSFLKSKSSSSEILQRPSTSTTNSDSTPLPSSTSAPGTNSPSIQAALPFVLTAQSNNIVNTKATYEVLFRTTTAGTIKTVQIAFPSGTNLNGAIQIETIGIGNLIGNFDMGGKEIFDMGINAEKPVHVLLCGPPASSIVWTSSR
jgi:hypothetical protein